MKKIVFVIIYTNDYEILDIPLTFNDCYIALNNLLEEQVKNDLKTSSVNDLLRYHMGLGMWIRNNWIIQAPHSRIAALFLENDARQMDDISQAIIIGYHFYLNKIEKTIEELLKL